MLTAATPAKAEKVPQILTIEPDTELVFRGPFTDAVTTILKLSNPSDKKVCFKVKTTAPKTYRVRPTYGLVEPSESVDVNVKLQPFDYKDENESKRHKFLVQSIIPTGDIADIRPGDVESLWKSFSEKYPLMESKLKTICMPDTPKSETEINNHSSTVLHEAKKCEVEKKTNTKKVPQILTIEPDTELVFRGPFTDAVTTILKLSNPSDKKVCFKVKTTAPKTYRVRPTYGLVEPNESVDVNVKLQPPDYKAENESKRHEFLVQSVIPTGDMADIRPGDVESLWKSFSDKYPLMHSKLKTICRPDTPKSEIQTNDHTSTVLPEAKKCEVEKKTNTKKVPQILIIEPDTELVFRGPFTDVVTTILKLSNPSDKKVCFKVKTTAPDKYFVRPNSGLIEPSESVDVNVKLQPFDDKDENESKRHKLLVQSVIPTGDIADIRPGDVESLWKSLPDKYSLMESKLKTICMPDTPKSETEINNHPSTVLPGVKRCEVEKKTDTKKCEDAEKPDVDDGTSCIICYKDPCNAVLVPCGHMWLCYGCAMEIQEKGEVCPACRAKICTVVKVYALT